MDQDVDARIETLLDQLENRHLTEAETQRIQQKIEFLKSLKG